MENTATIYIETLKMPDGSLLGLETVFIDIKHWFTYLNIKLFKPFSSGILKTSQKTITILGFTLKITMESLVLDSLGVNQVVRSKYMVEKWIGLGRFWPQMPSKVARHLTHVMIQH